METASLANSWVDSYLDALLSSGLSTEYIKKPTYDEPETPSGGFALAGAEKNIAAKYYVNQILNLDEEACQHAWQKVSRSASNSRLVGEKDARLQYLSWRVWGMRRKLNDNKDANAAAIRELRAKETAALGDHAPVGGVDDAEELSKIFPGSRLKSLVIPETDSSADDFGLLSPELPSSPTQTASTGAVSAAEAADAALDARLSEERQPKLYCVLISMHGLVRGQRMELGKDPDTGGQVKYVVELAAALSKHPAVHRVDLLTRLIRDPKVDESYGRPEELLTEKEGEMGGAYIVRLACGPQETYLKKEHLWPYVREFADNSIQYVQQTMQKLQKSNERCELYYVHGHYADAGEAAALISYTLGCDMVLTGHSLGRNKLDHLLKSGTVNRAEIETTYAIGRRIEGEERALDAATMVFTSTEQEVKDQWGLYDGYDDKMERVLRRRHRRGHFPLMTVIPPGLDFSNLKVAAPADPWDQAMKSSRSPRISSASNLAGQDDTATGDQDAGTPKASSPRASRSGTPRAHVEDARIWREIFRFLRNPRKPVILAMSRPDAKKNITTLVKAYGSNAALREIANLVLIMGNRDIIDSMAPGSQKVLGEVLKLIDAYNLYGSVAYPKSHSQKDISDIYLLPAATRGVFVNIALQEPFGLTLIEAAAHGVPIVATTHGGPVDIIKTLHNGILVDPTDERGVQDALLSILTSPVTWDEYSANGVNNINAYAWPSHCVKALRSIEAEKIGMSKRRRNVIHSTMSFDLDELLAAAPEAATPGSGGEEGGVQRGSSYDDLNLVNEVRSSNSGSTPFAGNGGAADDMMRSFSMTSPGHHERSQAEQRAPPASTSKATTSSAYASPARMLQQRKKYVVFVLDGQDTVDRIRSLLRNEKKLLGLGGNNVGLGVATTGTFAETKDMLGAAGLHLKDLDFVIANAGSEIWYCGASEEPGLDEAYETHINERWDKRMVQRLLESALKQRAVLLGTAAAPKGGAEPPLPKVAVGDDTSPHHLMAALSGVGGAGEMQALMGRVRAHLRRNGWRTQLVTHAAGSASKLHITPIRASRALAVRFLARRHKVDLKDVVMVCCASALEGEGAAARFATSDMEDVVAGVQEVLVVPGKGGDGLESFQVDLDLYKHDKRLQVLPA